MIFRSNINLKKALNHTSLTLQVDQTDFFTFSNYFKNCKRWFSRHPFSFFKRFFFPPLVRKLSTEKRPKLIFSTLLYPHLNTKWTQERLDQKRTPSNSTRKLPHEKTRRNTYCSATSFPSQKGKNYILLECLWNPNIEKWR